MSKRSRQVLRYLLLFVLGIFAVIGIIIIAELSVMAKKTPTPDLKLSSNRQPAYPQPGLARVNQASAKANVYPPPGSPTLSPTKGASASPTTSGGLSLASVPKTSIKDAKTALDGNKAIFVDVRTKEAYDRSHIPGALSIPESQIKARVNELDTNQWIITYCS